MDQLDYSLSLLDQRDWTSQRRFNENLIESMANFVSYS